MTSRTVQIGASFAIVLVAYWTYALLALPWIETPLKIDSKRAGRTTKGPSIQATPNQEFAFLFAADEWERHDAKIISSSEQVYLLWKTYANHPNGWVDLNPLTVIFVPDDSIDDPRERYRQAIVMQVPGGASLHFDRPLDLNRDGIGRLIEGRLRGQVKIRSQGKQPDHRDDLLVLTHDVELTEQRISTPHQVEFWFGPNYGRGRQMEMKLLPRLGPRVANQGGPNIGGVEQVQLQHVERLRLDMGPDQKLTGLSGLTGTAGQFGRSGVQSGPAEIACCGPFCFDFVHRVATFRDQVDVVQTHPNAPSDHLTCDRLSVFFTPAEQRLGETGKSKPTAAGFDLQPARIAAEGSPARLESPLEHFRATAGTLQYSLSDRQIYLEDRQEVLLQKDGNEVRTPRLRFVPGPQDHANMFRLLADGPGFLRGEMADRPGQQLEARWQTKLEVRPQDQNQVVSLTGGAALKFQAMGQLDAQEIHFWLRETPRPRLDGAAGGQTSFQPDRLLAQGNVVGDSPQLSSKVDRLEVWFSSAPPTAVATSASGYPIADTAPPPYIPSIAGGPPPMTPPTPQTPAAGAQQGHLEITGRLLQARVTLHDRQQGDLTEVTIVDRVCLKETRTAEPGALPLLVTGDWLHATEANLPQAKVTVLGKPAHLEGRGMSLTGPNIAIDRGANQLVMQDAGEMEKLLDRDLENRPLSNPGKLQVTWQKGMTFDGRKAHFQGGVKVNGQSQHMETGWLEVWLQHPISFSEARPQQPPLVEKILCGEGVYVLNQTFEGGQQVSCDRIQLKDLDMNNLTGDFHANGPGRVVSVRRGGSQVLNVSGGPLAGPTPARPVAFSPSQPTADPNQMTCLDLRFMKSITGNKNRRELTFHGQVRAAHAGAQAWSATLEDEDPNRLGRQAVVLHSESLELADMSPLGGSSSGNLEFQARDNVRAEGANFTADRSNFNARCARLSYSQAKDQLIFEGDGRSDAELYKQAIVGGKVEPFKAQKIIYFQKTGQVNVDGFRSLEINPGPGKPGLGGR